MPASRRSMLAAMGASVASMGISQGAAPDAAPGRTQSLAKDVASLIQRSFDSNAALMRGDIDAYRALIELTGDFTLMSPFGGTPTRGAEMTNERWDAMGRFFKHGTSEQKLVESYATPDMVVLAILEQARVEVGGLPSQDWRLRVTLVYRRESSGWRLAHRHADPLVAGITLTQAASLARGEAL
jgi:ketosteroid isomerase-like protein